SAASCYLPFRGIRRWSWEVYWFLQGCFAWIIAPPILAIALVPQVVYILHNAPHPTLLYAFFWGAMWGIGGLLFGLGVRYLGIALGYTVALGFSTAFGTLVPPLFSGQLKAIAWERSGEVTLLGVVVCLFAIAISGVAGRRKELELAGREAHDAASPGGHGEFRFGLGLLVAALARTFSACFAYGLATAKPINDSARIILLAHGRSELWQSLPALIVVLWGGWLTNALWCGGLFLRNRSVNQLTRVPGYSGPRQLTINYLFSAAAGLLWYGQFFFYSMAKPAWALTTSQAGHSIWPAPSSSPRSGEQCSTSGKVPAVAQNSSAPLASQCYCSQQSSLAMGAISKFTDTPGGLPACSPARRACSPRTQTERTPAPSSPQSHAVEDYSFPSPSPRTRTPPCRPIRRGFQPYSSSRLPFRQTGRPDSCTSPTPMAASGPKSRTLPSPAPLPHHVHARSSSPAEWPPPPRRKPPSRRDTSFAGHSESPCVRSRRHPPHCGPSPSETPAKRT